MIRFSLLAVVFALLTLAACEGKKSLDGYPMDKPPPSAYAPRDSEPTFDTSDTQEANKEKSSKDQE
ncbi:hypothetical protein [Nitrosomonas ureae]|uniref:Lipoprotein-attachment site-containing protein n=1 Tax=Nitrosomonas ureae TaxID=44577 RepID=A0A0S3AIB4_9PROT|nr:hypothetical protein [Nitrosomonas ureae]ALQ50915.1 hypothetical protein ATY38_06535 [Nitrosomonas ureae]PTQ85336.1 hypothetical protein C8R28_101446 [Nitrosomonas ureae]PXX09346.1 hypothetical protein C8R27_1381 [Nitrosomonas ureae]SDU00303.1 hypothetical protein SAMN05216406_11647 [Nitrosomonas ureae]